MKRSFWKHLPLILTVLLVSWGCSQKSSPMQETSKEQLKTSTKATAQKKTVPVYKGKIVGKSNKASTISISVGKGKKAKTMMVHFDDNTKGLKHAVKGHAAIITYETRNGVAYAKTIKPKLAKLPDGVTEIKADELKGLIDDNYDMTLIDSRPGKRYAQSHLPGALSIPVNVLTEKGTEILDKYKSQLLVFYCGGPT